MFYSMKATLVRVALGCALASMFCQMATAGGVEIIAHRGASHDAPENTLESVKLGWVQGADAVEVDVYLSKDGHIVVHHDSDTKKLAGVDRKVVDQTLAELRQLGALQEGRAGAFRYRSRDFLHFHFHTNIIILVITGYGKNFQVLHLCTRFI